MILLIPLVMLIYFKILGRKNSYSKMTTELLLFKVLGNKNSTKEMAAEQEGPLYFCRSRMKDNRLRNIEFFCLGNGRKILCLA